MKKFFIKAINPGYKIDGVNNVGEMIEIAWQKTDEDGAMVSLAGLTLSYTNSSGNNVVLAEFPEHSFLTGENILLRLASSPESELAAINYTKTLAFKAGPLVLKLGDEILDEVCWTGKESCSPPFDGANPTTLVRNLETGEFEHRTDYEPKYVAENYYIEEVDDGYGGAMPQCEGLQFTELLSYYVDSKDEQFVEFYNSGAEQILLDGCKIKYKNKVYPLSGVVQPEEYFVRYLNDFNVAKNPASLGVLELLDTNDVVVDKLEYPNGQRKGTSYILIGTDADGQEIWRVTYVPTPGEANNYQEYKPCEEGKVINEETGNCVKVVAGPAEKICPAGQELNEETGRCRKIATETEKTCKDGYYLDEETGRCKKIKENTGANYELNTGSYQENSVFVGVIIVVVILVAGLGYIGYEFRHELRKLLSKVCLRFRGKRSRGPGRH